MQLETQNLLLGTFQRGAMFFIQPLLYTTVTCCSIMDLLIENIMIQVTRSLSGHIWEDFFAMEKVAFPVCCSMWKVFFPPTLDENWCFQPVFCFYILPVAPEEKIFKCCTVNVFANLGNDIDNWLFLYWFLFTQMWCKGKSCIYCYPLVDCAEQRS